MKKYQKIDILHLMRSGFLTEYIFANIGRRIHSKNKKKQYATLKQ